MASVFEKPAHIFLDLLLRSSERQKAVTHRDIHQIIIKDYSVPSCKVVRKRLKACAASKWVSPWNQQRWKQRSLALAFLLSNLRDPITGAASYRNVPHGPLPFKAPLVSPVPILFAFK